ncbi:hypothetical protein [Methanohalobium sp.]|uniref:hypothetical protein n=1 Tax=Methanohalobium sp. TaxID=2837493 RepID=UPI0025FBA2EB|nr:hypothetical protein [Methanohalobium sp.]
MVDQYPHSAIITYTEEGSYDESTGKYSGGTKQTIDLPECRFEYQGKNYQQNENGDIEGYDYMVYAPVFDDEIRDYSTIYWNEEGRSLTVKHTEKYHYHAKIWANS